MVAGKHVLVIPAGLQPFDLASILLAASALILTAVGAVVAVAALFGYKQIVEMAKRAATEVAEREARIAASEIARRTASAEARDFLRLSRRAAMAPSAKDDAMKQALVEDDGDD